MATNPTLIGRVLAGRYRIEARRGAGDHGIVLDAHDQQLDRTVAVKVLLPHYVASTATEARFRFEAQSAASLTHPNLDAVYDWGVEFVEGTKVPYLVLEHLGGGSLRDILDRGRLLSPSQALVVGLDVCRGLDYMHRRGVIHRELKPANLAFGDDRHVRILDVGLSRMVAEEIWRDPTEAGLDAARYASPEQAKGGSPADGTLDGATDIYSLTLILIEAVTGQIPFASDSTVATLNARIDKLMPVSADFGPLASVLSRAGSAEPADRYTAAELGRALVQAAEKLPRPAAMPIVGTTLFNDGTGGLRRPSDPTGPARRPAEPTGAIPVTEADPPAPAAVALATEPAIIETDAAAAAASEGAVGSSTAATNGVNGTLVVDQQTVVAPVGGPPDPSGGTPRPALYDEAPEPPKRRRRGWAFAGAFLVLALVAGGIIGWKVLDKGDFTVPDLVGVDEGVARNQVAGHDWTIVVQRERDDIQPQGHIIRTDPPAGEKLTEGESVTFVVSDGATLSTLPDVTGLTVGEATATLTTNKLDLIVADEVYDEVVPAGTIISWMVPAQPGLQAGMEVMQRTVVAVTASIGPAPREVPQLIGLDPAAAQAAIDSLQLVLIRDVDKFSNDYPAGIVADQSLPAGTPIQRGESVTIAVSMGQDLVAVPPLAGLTYDQTVAALSSVGLTVGTVSGNQSTGLLYDARVAGKALAAGQQLLRGTAVDVFYF